jgi:hypothetical protein
MSVWSRSLDMAARKLNNAAGLESPRVLINADKCTVTGMHKSRLPGHHGELISVRRFRVFVGTQYRN